MSIKIQCECGHAFRVGESFRDGKVRCPKCRQWNVVAPNHEDREPIVVSRCPVCKTEVAQRAVLCIACGYDFRTGQHHKSEVPERPFAAGGGAWAWVVFRKRFRGLLIGIFCLVAAIVGPSRQPFSEGIPPTKTISDDTLRLAGAFQRLPSVLPANESKFLVTAGKNLTVKIAFPSVTSLQGQWRLVDGKVEVRGAVAGIFAANEKAPPPLPWQEKAPDGEVLSPATSTPQFEVTLPIDPNAAGKTLSATATLEVEYPQVPSSPEKPP